MASKKRGLGRGLDALFADAAPVLEEENTAMIENIVESIAKQKDSVEGVEGEITNISELSDTLRIQFKQKKEEAR